MLHSDFAQVGNQEIAERHMPLHRISPFGPKLIVTKTRNARAVTAIRLSQRWSSSFWPCARVLSYW
jgi:hypothetical protein